jgi:heme exporter protein C
MKKFFSISNIFLDNILPYLVLLLGLISAYYYYVAPFEVVMGAVQKILYLHVGSVTACYAMLIVIFVSSVCYLSIKDRRFYLCLDASSYVSIVFCSIILISGMIWGHSSWNTWWRWEPRLTSVLILWLLLFVIRYCNKINFQAEEKETFMSILGVLSAIQAPIIIYSIKLLNRTEQLHPEVVEKQGLKDPGYVLALMYNNISLLLLSICLCRLFYRYLKVEDKRISIKRKL